MIWAKTSEGAGVVIENKWSDENDLMNRAIKMMKDNDDEKDPRYSGVLYLIFGFEAKISKTEFDVEL